MRRFNFVENFTREVQEEGSEAQKWVNSWLAATNYVRVTPQEAGPRLHAAGDSLATVSFDMTPAASTPWFLHKFSLLDAIEYLAAFVEKGGASPERRYQQLQVTPEVFAVIATLPQWQPTEQNAFFSDMVGCLLGRPVYRIVETRRPFDFNAASTAPFYLVTATKWAEGLVMNVPVSISTTFS
jgi:hypothetical protein